MDTPEIRRDKTPDCLASSALSLLTDGRSRMTHHDALVLVAAGLVKRSVLHEQVKDATREDGASRDHKQVLHESANERLTDYGAASRPEGAQRGDRTPCLANGSSTL